MKKILFIHHAAGWGGAPINMINIINSLDKTRYQAYVLLLKDSIVKEKLEESNIPYHIVKGRFYQKYYKYFSHTVPSHTPWYRFDQIFFISLYWIFSRFYFAPRELKNNYYDIIHLNSSVLSDWLAPSKKIGKVIMHIQEPVSKGTFGFRHNIFRFLLRKYTDQVLTISEDNSRRIDIPEKTKIVYNFISIPKYKPSIQAYKSKKVLYVGGAAYIKGFHILVDALAFLDKEINVTFAGYYPQNSRNSVKNLYKYFFKKRIKIINALKKLRNSSNSNEIGLVTNLSDLYEDTSCLVSPFSVEHFSRPIIEAFAYKKPVIATDIEGITEIVDDGKNGIIVPKDDPQALAKAINYLCKNPDIAKKMGEVGYDKAKKLYSANNINHITGIYDSLLLK